MTITKKELEEIVESAVAKGIEASQSSHKCGLCEDDPEAAKELHNIMEYIRELGEGNIAKGIRTMKENATTVGSIRKGLSTTRTEIIKGLVKIFLVALGVGLVVLFGDKIITK